MINNRAAPVLARDSVRSELTASVETYGVVKMLDFGLEKMAA